MPELNRNELFRFIEKAPKKVVSRYLTALGQGKQFKDTIETQVAQDLLAHVNTRMLQLENDILLGGLEPEKELEAKIEYKVLKNFAMDTLDRVNRYYKVSAEVKALGEK